MSTIKDNGQNAFFFPIVKVTLVHCRKFRKCRKIQKKKKKEKKELIHMPNTGALIVLFCHISFF